MFTQEKMSDNRGGRRDFRYIGYIKNSPCFIDPKQAISFVQRHGDTYTIVQVQWLASPSFYIGRYATFNYINMQLRQRRVRCKRQI